jgi:hypothetical protein
MESNNSQLLMFKEGQNMEEGTINLLLFIKAITSHKTLVDGLFFFSFLVGCLGGKKLE